MAYGIHGFPPSGSAAPAPVTAGAGDWFSPMQILRRLWSRRSLLFGVAASVFAGLALILFSLTPRYTGAAQILIEAPPAQATNPLQPTGITAADREKVVSEVQVVMSRGIAEQAVNDLNLETNPEFNPALDTSLFGRFKALLGAGGSHAEIVEDFYSHLNVYPVVTTRVIAVEFSSADPALARDAANRVAELYIEQQRRASYDLNAQARDWLSQQIDTLRSQVADAEARAEAFRARTGLLEGTAGVQIQSQQLSELNTQLGQARAARAEAEARVANMERLIGTDGAAESADSELEVLQSPLIQQLRGQEVQLKREITELSAQLLPSHPRMIQKQAELENLADQIRTEIQKVINSVRNQASVAAAREASAQRELGRLEARRAVADRDQIQLRALEREATANRSVLESFLSRYTEISTRGDLSIQEANARIISRAELPANPSFPQKPPMLVLAAMAALAAGLTTVFVAELTHRTLRHVYDVEAASGVPVLASLPSVGILPQDEALRDPGGLFADGIRSLHEGLGIFPAGNQRGRIVLVTSTARGEGRTSTAIALARFMAQGGLRVLLIDADFQQPEVEAMLGLKPAWGFSDLLGGRAGYKHVILRDPASNVHVMGAGGTDALAALASPRLQGIMAQLTRAYDVIVLDAAPVWSVEAHLLARLADQCVYAVRWDATERDRVTAGVRHLSASGVRGGIGVVLTCAEQAVVA